MGGSLLKEYGAKRVSTEEIETVFKPALSTLLEPLGLRYSFVKSYESKPDHGDIDILVDNESIVAQGAVVALNPNRKDVVIKFLNKNGYRTFVNSNVVSFLFNGCLQVDLIFTPTKAYSYSKAYFAYNDLGGLIGRLTRGLGMKHGHNGLYYVHYSEDKSTRLGEYLLTLDHTKTLEIVGLSLERFEKGFKDLGEIYDYVVSSPYFDYKPFIFEDMQSKDRTRDLKRKTFVEFEKYLELNKETLKKKVSARPEDKLTFVLKCFPHIQKDIEKSEREYVEKKELALKFNGNLVMELIPTLRGKALGAFLTKFKDTYSSEQISTMSSQEINEAILVLEV